MHAGLGALGNVDGVVPRNRNRNRNRDLVEAAVIRGVVARIATVVGVTAR